MEEHQKEEELKELKERLKSPFSSPEEASMRVASILARVLESSIDRFIRVSVATRHSPGSENYWNIFATIIDSGLKVINSLKAAYQWDEVIKKMKTASQHIREMEARGDISSDEAKAREQEVLDLIEAAERANTTKTS